MNKEQLWSKVNEFNEENSSVRLQIVHKNKNKNFYKFMDTDIKNKVQKEIFKLVNNSMRNTIRLNELVNFDPISKEDDTIEVIKVDKVSGYKEFKNNRENIHNYVTGYRTNYVENLEKALQEIKESNLINNIDRFCDDCKDSIKIAKRFTKAMANSSIGLILANLNDVEPAIKDADLPIKFINNKFEYEGKENLHDLVKLLSDEFAKTLIGKRITG